METRKLLRRALKIALDLTTVAVVAQVLGGLLSPPDSPLLNRNPAAWLYYWPTLLWSSPANVRAGNLNTIVSLVINIAAYTLVAYAFLRT